MNASVLSDWAHTWAVSDAALADLRARMGASVLKLPAAEGASGSESRQQSLVRIEAAKLGMRLWRNNSGAFKDDTGRVVRYGLANDSAALNEVLKSPDLIGWRALRITSDMVGAVIGQCVMREIKHEGWTFRPNDPHEAAQLAFLQLALADGCDAMFCTGPGTL